jgi:hypothetical protein
MSTTPWSHRRIIAASLAVAGAFATSAAHAFAMADGTIVQCIARGAVVPEVYAGADNPFAKLGRTGLAERIDGGYRITWNTERLASLPPEVRDFIFFHECAHARVPTENELEANCAGLLDMRAAGRAGPAFEKKLRSYFPGVAYWADTFTCADAAAKLPQHQPKPAP